MCGRHSAGDGSSAERLSASSLAISSSSLTSSVKVSSTQSPGSPIFLAFSRIFPLSSCDEHQHHEDHQNATNKGGQQRVTQDVAEVLGHDRLLLHATVVLQRQDDWEVRCLSNRKEETHRAALTPQLVLQEVGVVRGGDEVVAERLAHVLVELPVLGFKYGALPRFVAVDQLLCMLGTPPPLLVLLDAQEVLQLARHQHLPVFGVVLEHLPHLVPLRQHLVEMDKLLDLQRAALRLVGHLWKRRCFYLFIVPWRLGSDSRVRSARPPLTVKRCSACSSFMSTFIIFSSVRTSLKFILPSLFLSAL
ncbi:hypothetical protein EYF80_021188 [Liparis tanakae]|uniref:Uncharacterized protein n=1 Tax=Liparis tanakae TaxID=230148 RepID=A0A4Z2HUG4_9TELE|nr:hypothetical protein EYF80_021188 [Liparis tanakae]